MIVFDDQSAIIDTLQNYFNNAKGFRVIATFQKSKDILNYLKSNSVDIIITEILTHEELGTELISMIRKLAPKSFILVYSAAIFSSIKENCLNARANLCINKRQNLKNLHEAILDLQIIQETSSDMPKGKNLNNYTLTNKEMIIIEYMIMGMTSLEIAEKLNLSTNTINNQKNHMIKKFDCNSSTELVAKLFRNGYLKV